jgi:hypothetical protein
MPPVRTAPPPAPAGDTTTASEDASAPSIETPPISTPSIYYDPNHPTETVAVASAPVRPPAPTDGSAPEGYASTSYQQDALARPTYTTPSVPNIENPGNDDVLEGPPETQEIPQAIPDDSQVAMLPPGTATAPHNLTNYSIDDPNLPDGIGNLRDFMSETEETSSIGFEVRETRRKLKTGEELSGLLILKVEKDSAAARAGLRPFRATAHKALEALAIGATLAFPPAILAVPAIDYADIGESYDMIVGVDGVRVARFIDFEERMRDIRPGELVYLSLVRDGTRVQIPVAIPSLSSSATY